MTQRYPRRGLRYQITLLMMAACASLLAVTARADIVWEGKTVASWPEGAYDADPTPYLAKKFYPSPRGVVMGLTILVDFSDQASAFTKPQIEAWLNERNYNQGGLNGSVRDYYFDVSNGIVDFQNAVVGFYRAKNPKSYYEGGSGYARSDELFAEVIAALDPEIDFSTFDSDKDGRPDAISLGYAGEGVKWGHGLWPHASGSGIRADGVTLSRYMMFAISRKLALYTFCHEVGHMLFGWPDLYGFGDYCLMGNASNPVNPAGINDFFRADQGWIPQIEITQGMNATVAAPASGAGFRYTNPADDGECFFWSNVQKQGRWSVLRGSGLLFFHYNRSVRVNDPPNPLALAVVQADGRDELGQTQWPSPGSDPKDFFFGGGTMELSDKTTPSSKWKNGSSSGLRVYDIGANGPEIQFRVGTQPPADDTVIRPDAGPGPAPVADAGGAIATARDAGAKDAGTRTTDLRDAGSAADPRGQRDAGRQVDARVADREVDAADGDDDDTTPAPPADRESGGCSAGTAAGANATSSLLALLVMLPHALRSRRRR